MTRRCRTILFIHPSDELYGSDRCLLDIIRGLPPGDRAIVVLPTDLPYAGVLSRELVDSGAVVKYVDMLVLRRSLLQPVQLPLLIWRFLSGTLGIIRLLRRYDADIVHSNTVAVVCGASAAALTSTPHIWHVHEHIGDEPRLYRMLIRLMLTIFPGRIIANSRSVARALIGASQVRLKRTRLVENSFDPTISPVDRSGRGRAAPLVVGVVGRLSSRKGTAEAIEAAGILAASGRRFEMRFVGAVPPNLPHLMQRYVTLVRDLSVESYVTFAGQIDDIRTQLEQFDLLLLPSQRPEPFGLVVIEGMAAALPVVATLNGGGSDEILEHGATGIYCGRDPESMAAAIGALLDDPDRRRTLGRNAAAASSRRYARTRYQRDFVQIYERIAATPS